MKQWAPLLGAVCVAAGIGLGAPVHALAQNCEQISLSPVTFGIAESPEPSGSEFTSCDVPLPNLRPIFWNLLQPSPPNPLAPVSDYVVLNSNGTVNLISDPAELGLPLIPGSVQVPEIGPEGSNGAPQLRLFDNTSGALVGFLQADSDVPPVPEPPTVLLMASGGMLPFAFTYLKRRGRAKSQPKTV